jgi:hypothetical protein
MYVCMYIVFIIEFIAIDNREKRLKTYQNLNSTKMLEIIGTPSTEDGPSMNSIGRCLYNEYK